jgi:carbamate kinase
MGPKIEAAINFVHNSKEPTKVYAAIGDLKDLAKILTNEEGTFIKEEVRDSIVWHERGEPTEFKPPKLSQDPPKYG